jgi:hypothetical protein
MKNMLRYCLLPLLFCFCVSSKSNEADIPILEFAVIDSLLQKPVKDKELGISFRPPKNMDTLKSDSLVKKLNGLIVEKSTRQERRYIYSDSLFTSFFILNNAVSVDIKNIEEKYRKKFPQSEIRTGVFKKDSFSAHQIVLNLGKVVLVRLFFDAKKSIPFEVSFIFPSDTYSEQMKKVESVIGSIKHNESNH